MREILFRGKEEETGEWVYGYYSGPVGVCECHEICDINDVIGRMVDVDPETAGQYSGFEDKNGRKAFEGDCINHHFGPEVGIIRYGRYRNTFNDDQFAAHIGFYVEWKGPQANALRKDLGFWLSLNGVSIIGNIYDNPELIGGTEQWQTTD